MKTFIIILHYGDIRVTQACVASLGKKETANFEIVVVNNAKEKISKKTFSIKKSVAVINNERNLGFAAGVTIGVRYALSKNAVYILLLNNDTQIEKPFLKILTNFLKEKKDAGIAGPAIEFTRKGKHLFDLGGNLNTLFGRTSHTEVETLDSTEPRKTTYITGACMVIKKEVFEKVGMLDDQFFLYYEDVDFCLRAKEKGFSCYVLPEVVIHHELSKSAGGVSPLAVYHQTKSGVLFGKKYCKKMGIFNVLFLTAQSFLFLTKSWRLGKAAWRGMRDGLVIS